MARNILLTKGNVVKISDLGPMNINHRPINYNGIDLDSEGVYRGINMVRFQNLVNYFLMYRRMIFLSNGWQLNVCRMEHLRLNLMFGRMESFFGRSFH